MKRAIILCIALIIALFTLCSCYPGDAEYYESRFDELDISGRVNEVAYKIEKNRVNDILFKELDVIIDDLSHINTHNNPTVKNINSAYISSVKMLKASAEMRERGERRYATYLNMAKEHFQTATDTLNLAKNNERKAVENE